MTSVTSAPGERAMERMRRYTTFSLVLVTATFVTLGLIQTQAFEQDSVRIVSSLMIVVAGIAATMMMFFWERRAPLAVVIVGLALTIGAWATVVAIHGYPGVALVLALPLALLVTQSRHRLWWGLGGAVVIVLPVVVMWARDPEPNWHVWIVTGLVSYTLAIGLFLLNAYAWGLYLEIDAARRSAAELAVAQERFRFAADLHDIQGHTLHVIRLTIQLARRLMDTNPELAREHLLEAETLIGQTLASTRDLAFGEREVALAAEVANAQALFVAAGIRCDVIGDPGATAADELLGLAMRETTTNILRHAQATHVRVEITPSQLTITNDGSPEQRRPLSGLARLGERFESAGGSLSTRSAGDTFVTEASAP